MGIFNPILSWVYEKNYEFDRLPRMKRDMVFFGGIFSLMIFSGFVPALLMIIGKDNYSHFSYLILFVVALTSLAFRRPYVRGKLEKYMPEHIRTRKTMEEKWRQQQKRTEQQYFEDAAIKLTEDWRLPYLKVLDLDASATTEEIKIAYRKKAMIWHPDRNKSPKAKETFINIKNAYEKLT